MTIAEHERYYAGRSGMTVNAIHEKGGYSVVCDCDSMGCPGYSMIFAQRPGEWLEAIRRHVERGKEELAHGRLENAGASLSQRWFSTMVALAEGSKNAKALPPRDPKEAS